MDSIVPSGSDTVPPSLPVDVSLHLYGGGNLECFIYGHKCDLLSTSNSSLVKEVIAIEDLGGNHILPWGGIHLCSGRQTLSTPTFQGQGWI